LSFNHPQPHQPIQAGSGREAWMASGTGSASGRCYPQQSFPRNRGGILSTRQDAHPRWIKRSGPVLPAWQPV